MKALLETLASNGLNLIASAVMTKGKDVVENLLGIKLQEDMSPEQAMALKQAEFDHEEKLRAYALEERKLELDAEKAAGEAVTRRWEADLQSDNSLSKNIRPATLIYLLAATTIFALLDSIPALGMNIKQVWVDLFSDALQLVLFAYFTARTLEKGVSAWKNKKGEPSV